MSATAPSPRSIAHAPGDRTSAVPGALGRRDEPLAVVIAALGGQGGGVLTDWLVQAARVEGFDVQATSTPGVSQRTGATTYFVVIAPPTPEGSPAPALGLAPVPGRVDVLVCAELLEAARMLVRGMSTPRRTAIVASTHRVYTTSEKMRGDDARFDSARIVDGIRALSRRATLFDMEAIRCRHGTVISAALFGALAGSGVLPVGRFACEESIRSSRKGVAGSLAAFTEAFERARDDTADHATPTHAAEPRPLPAPRDSATDSAPPLPEKIVRGLAALPERVGEFARIGVAELIAYQDVSYAERYLDRVARIVIAELRAGGGDAHAVAREAARHLALWMRYDDVIRVASCKARVSRLARIRADAGVGDGAIVRVYDLFKPGALEIAAILPRRLGTWVERRALKKQLRNSRGAACASPGRSVEVQTSSVTGALALRLVTALRPLRPRSLRHAREQQAIEDWLVAIELALIHDRTSGGEAALDLARLPRLIRGYGETHATGRSNYGRILDAYRRGAAVDPKRAADQLRASAQAAFSDPACGQHDARPGAAAARSAAASSPA